MGLRELFFPKKRDFFKMLGDHAEKTEEGMRALHEFMLQPTADRGKRVEDLEEEADAIRKHLVEELNESFITPIDREDIFALSRSVDDMIDYAKTTVEEMTLFKVTPNEHLQKMTDALLNMAKDISLAVHSMGNHKPQATMELINRAKKAENFVEHRYREALSELFNSTDVVMILKLREVYRHISNAADRGDQAANIISDIMVKIT